MNKLRLFSSAYGHLSIDVLNSSVAMILTLAATQFGLTIAQIGFGAMGTVYRARIRGTAVRCS